MATRLYTLARELKFDAKLLMELATSKGINVKSHMSTVTDAQERTLRELVAEKQAAEAAASAAAEAAAATSADRPGAPEGPGPRRPSGRVQLKEGESAAHATTAPSSRQPAAEPEPEPAKPEPEKPKTEDAPAPKPAAKKPVSGLRKVGQITNLPRSTRRPSGPAGPRGPGGPGGPSSPGRRPGGAGGAAARKGGRGGSGRPGKQHDEVDLSFLRGSVNSSTLVDDPDIARRIRPVSKRRPRREDGGPVGTKARKNQIIEVTSPVRLRNFSSSMGVPLQQLAAYILRQGRLITLDEVIPDPMAEELAIEFEREIKLVKIKEAEDILALDAEEDKPEDLEERWPVVTVLGHVDHGKTSLLDKLRGSDVAGGESGGITQHIGASVVEKDDEQIVFLDTPGHAAFTEMRARGANITDIVVLVVAADDGVMPQTEEAINHARAAGVPMVVALNKIDKVQDRDTTINKIKGELAGYEVLVEEYGGDVQLVPCSAMTGEGVDDLLEAILLQAEIGEYTANPKRAARGTIIEASVEKGRGVVATVLIESGTLKRGDSIVAGVAHGRARMMLDDKGKALKAAGPATPVQLSGLSEPPMAGDKLHAVKNDSQARKIAAERAERKRQEELAPRGHTTLESLFDQMALTETKELRLLLKADAQGSVQALKHQLEELSTPEVRVVLLHKGVGAVTESDVQLADASDGIIVAFRVVPDKQAKALAAERQVEIRRYDIIYKCLDEIRLAMEGMLEPEERESIQSHVEIRKLFTFSRLGTIAGCYIQDGTLERTHKVRVIRDGRVIVPEANLASLRRFENDVKEVKQGFECGLRVEKFDDLRVGDILESYRIDLVKRTLDGGDAVKAPTGADKGQKKAPGRKERKGGRKQ